MHHLDLKVAPFFSEENNAQAVNAGGILSEKHAVSEQKHIYVASLDYDGCTAPCVPDVNLIKFLSDRAKSCIEKKGDEVVFINGSMRQSCQCDDNNNKLFKNGSCFPALIDTCNQVSQQTQFACRVDKVLTSDIKNNHRAGHSFDLALNESKINPDIIKRTKLSYSRHSDGLIDFTKIGFIYMQMHKIASENKDAKITFDFCDDTAIILKNLQMFYTANPDLIPPNVTLNLFSCINRNVTTQPVATITPVQHSKIDEFYRRNTMRLINQCHLNVKQFNIIDIIKNAKLFKRDRITKLMDEFVRDMNQYISSREKFIKDLNDYKNTRDAEDKKDDTTCFGVFKPIKKFDKVNAVTKLLKLLSGENVTPFTESEIKAIRHSRSRLNAILENNRDKIPLSLIDSSFTIKEFMALKLPGINYDLQSRINAAKKYIASVNFQPIEVFTDRELKAINNKNSILYRLIEKHKKLFCQPNKLPSLPAATFTPTPTRTSTPSSMKY